MTPRSLPPQAHPPKQVGHAATLRLAAIALALLSTAQLASGAQAASEPRNASTLNVTGPSIVIVRASPAEMKEDKEKARSEEDFAEANKDLQNTAAAFVKAMHAYPGVNVTTSSADVIRFAEPNVPPVWRYSVGTRTAYVFYQPGKPVRVFSGVRTADGLVCEAARLFELKPKPPKCDA